MSKKHSLKKTCGAILGLYVLLAVLFVVLAQDYIRYTPEETTAVGETTEKDLGELTDGMSVMQVLDQELRYVSRVEAYFLTYGRENKGTVRMRQSTREMTRFWIQRRSRQRSWETAPGRILSFRTRLIPVNYRESWGSVLCLREARTAALLP